MWIRVGVDRVVNIVIIFSPYKSIFQSVAIDILWFALVLLGATMYDPARIRIIYADKLKEYKSKKLAHNQHQLNHQHSSSCTSTETKTTKLIYILLCFCLVNFCLFFILGYPFISLRVHDSQVITTRCMSALFTSST